jgi:hypothetical protein
MAIVESKLKTGSLKLGVAPGVEFGCQPTNVRLEPTFDDIGDPVETLCGDTLGADSRTTWAMMGTSIQDFDDPDGFVFYAYDNNLVTVDFVWTPNEGLTSFAGQVQVRAVVIGGDVNTRITSDFEWPVQGDVTVTKPAALLASSARTTSSATGSSTPAAA